MRKLKMSKNEKKTKTTDILCILDRSGSMSSLAEEVISSYNNFVKEQKEEDDPAKLSLFLFDDKYECVLDRVSLDEVPVLTDEVYSARGYTALNDAIGKTILNFPKPNKKKVICLIQTDGVENMSKEFKGRSGLAKIQQMIKEKEDLGWQFVFLGANIDAQATATSFGMTKGIACNVQAGAQGVKSSYNTMSNVTRCYRTNTMGSLDTNTSDASDTGTKDTK